MKSSDDNDAKALQLNVNYCDANDDDTVTKFNVDCILVSSICLL